MALYRGPGGAGDATNNATNQAILAAASAAQAAASAAAASASASQAATSATNSASSATASANSATAAASSANSASTSATNAANSATAAQTAQTAAELAETNAETAEANAETAEANATASASLAQDWATKTSGPVAGGEYSSKYNAQLAATSATNAANSATSASTSASAASTSATNAASSATAAASSASAASTSATNAANSATAAATSATSAASSASTATTQASNAASSATAAATSASNAATSETNAANSASVAATSATNAANSATSASTSATNAANSATAAAASYDSFDDRYLGSKASNPTLDNDGNALLTGALYWNSTVGEMRVYNGSTWVAAYVSSTAYVQKAGDVMTGSLEVPTQASLKATTLTRASIRPSLLLDFSNTKQLDPRITFSRPTTATYFDSNGVLQTAAANVARFDHDPVTGESKGLLIEEQRTNLFLRSQEFNTTWFMGAGGTGAITADQTTAPDGTLSADLLYDLTTANNYRVIEQDISLTSASSYSISCFVKAAGNGFAYLRVGQATTGNNIIVYFNLNSGVVGTSNRFANTNSPTIVSSGISSVGNSWYRISVAFTTNVTASHYCQIGMSNADNTFGYVGNGTNGIYIWGAQLEAGSFPTSYIPTVASQVTRSADSASMTGSNFSSWYRADEGTLYSEANTPRTSGYGQIVQIGVSGSIQNRLDIGLVGPSGYITTIVGGTEVSNWNEGNPINLNKYASGAFAKVALGYKVNDTNAACNGAAGITDTVCAVPIVSQLLLGVDVNGRYSNGTIKRIAFWPKRLSNSELQGLTS